MLVGVPFSGEKLSFFLLKLNRLLRRETENTPTNHHLDKSFSLTHLQSNLVLYVLSLSWFQLVVFAAVVAVSRIVMEGLDAIGKRVVIHTVCVVVHPD